MACLAGYLHRLRFTDDLDLALASRQALVPVSNCFKCFKTAANRGCQCFVASQLGYDPIGPLSVVRREDSTNPGRVVRSARSGVDEAAVNVCHSIKVCRQVKACH